MATWRVDHASLDSFRPNTTEFYATEKAAMRREAELLRTSKNVCAWFDCESTGPWVEVEAVA